VNHQEAGPLHLEKVREGTDLVPKVMASPEITIPIPQDPDPTPKALPEGAGFLALKRTDTTREMGKDMLPDLLGNPL